MKILIAAGWYWPNIVGGGEKVTQLLAEALHSRGHDTAIVTLTEPEGRYKAGEVNGVRVHYLPLRNLYLSPLRKKDPPVVAKALWHALDSYNPFMASALGRILDAERPDVVNTHNLAGFSVSAWNVVKKRRFPLVHTIHSYYLLCPKCTLFRGGGNCARRCADCRVYGHLREKATRLVDAAIGVSQYVLDEHERYTCFARAERLVVHNACEMPPDTCQSAKRWNGSVRFGYLGRLHPTKGTDLLLKSFLELPVGSATLTIAGRGEVGYERGLRTLADGHAGIQWLGFVSPKDILRKIDVLIVPSPWRDPAPLVVQEGMAHGLAIIGSRRGGIPELMGAGTGWTFDPGESGALTRTMQHAIRSRGDLTAMAQRSRERARQFSVDAMLDGYMKAYLRAIQRNGEKAEIL